MGIQILAEIMFFKLLIIYKYEIQNCDNRDCDNIAISFKHKIIFRKLFHTYFFNFLDLFINLTLKCVPYILRKPFLEIFFNVFTLMVKS